MTFQEYKQEVLKDPELKKEYDALEPEYEAISAIIAAKDKCNFTQAQLAKASGVKESEINRIEMGCCSPTLATLQKLASAMGKKVHIEFI